jgi:hypothetical protein
MYPECGILKKDDYDSFNFIALPYASCIMDETFHW